jgi:hypothetical protein
MKMARTKKVAEAVKGQAKAEVPEQPKEVKAPVDLESLLASTGAQASQAKPKAKKETFDVKVADEQITSKITRLLKAAARQKAAAAREKGVKGELRPVFDKLYFDSCHAEAAFLKTIQVNEAVNYSAGHVGMAAIVGNTTVELTAALVARRAKLIERLGPEGYAKWVKSTTQVRVAATVANIELLKKKLTKEEFAQIISYVPNLDLVTVKEGSDDVVVLKRDMALDPKVEAAVRASVKEGLLTLSDGAITPQKSALAVVEEELLKEEKAKDEAEAKAKAAAAQPNAGQVAGAVVEAVVNAAATK